jgi:hypothetical protein
MYARVEKAGVPAVGQVHIAGVVLRAVPLHV